MSSPGEAVKKGDGSPEAVSSDKNNNQQVEASAEANSTAIVAASTDSVVLLCESQVRAEGDGDDDNTAKADKPRKTQVRARKDSVTEAQAVADTPRSQEPPEMIRLREDFETEDDLVMAICHGLTMTNNWNSSGLLSVSPSI